jgi:spermidine synthase
LEAVIYLFFFISGFTGLVYEVVWVRVFGLVFGNTTLAASTVLASFMAGLALGSIVLGRYADRTKNPLRLYALMELGIGCAACFVLLLQRMLEPAFTFLFLSLENTRLAFHLVQFIILFLISLPVTFLMGGTLPALSRAVIRDKQQFGRGLGNLYSVNTWGGVLGSFITAFVFISMLGVAETAITATVANILVAGAAYVLSGRIPAPGIIKRKSDDDTPQSHTQIRWILLIMMGSGFTALSYEVLWNRILVFILTNSVFAFSVMLTTVLVGIALGAVIGGRFADKNRNPLLWLGVVECGIGVSAFLTGIILIHMSSIHNHLFILTPNTTWWQWNGIRFVEAFLVMCIPTFLMGVSFPLA